MYAYLLHVLTCQVTSVISDSVTLGTHWTPLSMGFSRQECWSGFIFIILAENSIIYAYYVIFKSFESMILKSHPGNKIFIFNLWQKLFQCLNT